MNKMTMLKVFICLLIVCTVANCFIGQFIFRMPQVEQQSEIGKRYSPGGKVLYSSEGYAKFVLDGEGYNNEANRLQKDGRLIIVLGDSITEAFQVPRDDNFCSKTMRLLNQSDQSWIVYNMGIAGNSIAEYIAYGDSIIKKFNPDYIVLEVTSNDFTDDALNKTKNCYIANDGTKFAIVHESGNRKKLKEMKDSFKAFSPLTAQIYAQFSSIWPKLLDSQTTPFLQANGKQEESEEDIVTGNDYSDLISWEFEQLHRIYGDKLILLYVPSAPYIDENGSVQLNEKQVNVYTINIAKEICRNRNIPFIDPSNHFKTAYAETKVFPRGFSNANPGSGHLNNLGHNLLADKVAEYFLNLELKE